MEQPRPLGQNVQGLGPGLALGLFSFANFLSSDHFLTVPGIGGKQPLSPECFPVTAAFSGEGAISTLGRASSQLPAPEKLELLKGIQECGVLPMCLQGQGLGPAWA